jgi:hypothetical protein
VPSRIAIRFHSFVAHEAFQAGECLTIFELGPKHVRFHFRPCRFNFRLVAPGGTSKFLQSEKAGVGGSTPSLATIRIEGRRYLGSLPPLRRKNGIFHIYGTYEIIPFMKQESIRTTVDIPAPLYRKLKEQAAGTGSSIRELVLLGVRRVVLQAQRPRPKRVEFPLIVSKGPQVDLTNEQIYEYVEFP